MIDDFLDEMVRMQREFDRAFGLIPERGLIGYGGKAPAVWKSAATDIKETDNEVIAKFDLPGVDKKDIELNVDENSVSVKAEKKSEVKEDKKGYFRMERSYRGFCRQFALPAKVIPDKANAEYKDRVLTVTMPKAEPKKVAGGKRLQIK